ncbi:MAG: calcineurin-like phosphoesterase family protein [Pseudomonadota bacterium]
MRIALIVLVSWSLLVAHTVYSDEEAQGVVYEDIDADGIRDPDEAGIAGVRLSNGRNITVTDAQGAYQISLRDGDILFLTKPAGYMTPVSKDMLPRFYYIHQPNGSPSGLRYPGIAPTGPLPLSIDFGLRRRTESERFQAILLADTQPATAVEVDWLRDDAVAELIGTPALFGMTMGDIMYDDLSLFPRFNAVIGAIGIPWYNVPGNHDLNMLAEDDKTSLETFKRYFGPPYYSFEVANAVFYVLDNIEYQGRSDDPDSYRGEGRYEAVFGKQQLKWLERDLEFVPENKLVFLAMHAPLETYLGDAPTITTRDRRALFDLLSGREHLYAVAGHTHTTEHHYFGDEDGFAGPGELHHHILTTVSGSWWGGPLDARGIASAMQRDGTPNGHHILEVDGNQVTVRYQAASESSDKQLRIMIDADYHHLERPVMNQFRPGDQLDGRISVDQVPSTRVLVNLFDGGPKSTIRMQIGKGQWIPMVQTSRPDPLANELFERYVELFKPFVSALPSSHIWSASLPQDLVPGTYTLSVSATDEFGRSHHGHRILEIMGSSAPQSADTLWPDAVTP